MPRTILIVDDNAVERAMLTGYLKNDFDVLTAESGREMLEILRERARGVSAIVLDLVMPEMDGFEALRRIRDNAVYRQIPVITASSLTDEDSQVRALSLGAGGYAFKPYNREILLHLLENTISLREKSALSNTMRRDVLTGLLNRARFFETAEMLIKRREPGSYILSCFDIENFKVINDQYGVEAGDAVLRAVAGIIDRGVAELGGVCCRYSADNFGLLYPAQFRDSPQVKALHEKLAVPDVIDRSLRVRIGRYLVDDLTVPVSAMYDRANLAEESIRGRYDVYIADYSDSMRVQLLNEQRIINDMRRALAQDEFEPWLQPQYNHITGAIIGAEALVRWKKNGAYISPAEFVPVFERNGFIYEMDQYVWERVCMLLRKWLDEGRSPLPVSVNVSRRDLFHKHAVDVLENLVKKYDIPHDLLRLEVTESAFAESTGQIIAKVGRLIELGFVVEIDDFGSGYSSLNTLKDVPASILKLDMKFFENTKNQQRSGNIVESVVRMAKWLGMSVIAEGVEEKAQADYLKSIGCYYIQGYYYARPMPAAEYERLLDDSVKEPELARLKTLDNLDNNEFWNPKSMETLIFNSYVGGACIFEYNEGKTEMLRVNDQYVRQFGRLIPGGGAILEKSPLRYMDPENKQKFFDCVRRAMQTHQEAACELLLTDACDGGTRAEYVRVTLRAIARTGERYLFYCGLANMTEQRLAEQRQLAAEKEQLESAGRLRVVMENVSGGVSVIQINDDASSKLIFNNDRYYELYGCTQERAQAEALDVMRCIVPDDLPGVMEKVRKLKAGGESAVIDYRIIRCDGKLAYLRANASRLYMDGYGAVMASVVMDITEQQELSGQLRFLNESAREILAQPDSGLAVNVMLKRLLDYFAGDRAYVVEFHYAEGTSDNTYEVCAPGVKSEIELLHDLPLSVSDYWINELSDDRFIAIADVSALGEDKAELHALLEEQSIRSLIVAPLWRDGALVGFLGVDNPRRAAEQLDRLKAVGDYIAMLLTRRDLTRKIELDNDAMQQMVNDTPGGFLRMEIRRELPPRIVTLNGGLCRMLGLTRREVMETYGENAVSCLVDEDVLALKEKAHSRMDDSGQFTGHCHLRRADGTPLHVQAACRFVRDGDGRMYVNIHFTDYTRRMETEQQQKALLDNLSCGAALYEYDGAALRAVHLNKSYWELVGREPADGSETSIFDAVHPDDRAMVRQELEAAIRQSRNFSAAVRILCGGGTYKPFRIEARLLPGKNGVTQFFASYTPVSEQVMSVQQMLPIALSTMMSASEDAAYLKDKELRYLCCSQAMADTLGLESVRDVVGKTDFDLFDTKTAENFRAHDREVCDNGAPVIRYTERVAGQGGRVTLVSTDKYPIVDADGGVVGLYGVSRDITAQRERESQLELLTKSIPGGIAAYAIDENGVRMLYFNDGFFSFSGCTREEYAALVADDPLSLVFEEDKHFIREMIEGFAAHREDGHVNGAVYRCHTKDGGYRWMSMKTVLSRMEDESYVVNAVQFDVTEQQEEKERLRVSEELNRLAIEQSGRFITRYDTATRRLILPETLNPIFSLPHVLEQLPDAPIDQGCISPDTQADYREMFAAIHRGEKTGSATYKRRSADGWRWLEARYTTVFSSAGKPVSAVISFTDVTERLEKEVVYNKWQQSLRDRPKESYTLFRCNLSKGIFYESREGSLLDISFEDTKQSFQQLTAQYIARQVQPEDRAVYAALMNADTLLAGYHRGVRSHTLEYRETRDGGGARWLRLSVDLVEYPSSRDVEIYLMYEDIDEQKREQLLRLERSEKDPLTGVYNRAAFIERVQTLLRASMPGESHALLMLDVDDFKSVNDTLGHGAGDALLTELTVKIRSVLRHDDLLGRMGGDEFFVFLKDVLDENAVAAKARQICALELHPPGSGVRVTVSIGAAMLPRSGGDFDTVYRKVDKALYSQKARGKNGWLFVKD